MTQHELPLTVFWQTATCDQCNVELHATGDTAEFSSAVIHVCPKCFEEYYLDDTFPRLVFRDAVTGKKILEANRSA